MSSEPKIQGCHPSDAIVALVGYYSGEIRRYQAIVAAQGEFIEKQKQELERIQAELESAAVINGQQATSILELRERIQNSKPQDFGEFVASR